MPTLIGAPLNQGDVADDSDEKVKVGDTVSVFTLKGRKEDYEVTKIESDGFVGTSWDKRSYRVYYKDIRNLKVKRFKWRLIPL